MSDYFSPQEILLTTEQVAKRTGLTPRFWESRRLSGDTPPFIRLGHRVVRYRWNDVEKWLAARVCTSTSDQGQSINKGKQDE